MRNYQHRALKIKILIFLLFINIESSFQQSCVLPDQRHSTCTLLSTCQYFTKIIISYKNKNQAVPESVRNDVYAHKCPSNPNMICCPDYAVSTTTKTPTTTAKFQLGVGELLGDSYEKVRNHPNINLINEKSCGPIFSNRVVGGQNAELFQFPWVALLAYRNMEGETEFKCGGSLITKRYILTAAHCLKRELAFARLGEHTISSARDCDSFNYCADPVQDIPIEKQINHPSYRNSGRNQGPRDDIALLKLASLVDTTKNNVKTICLPARRESDFIRKKSTQLTITGWGQIGEGYLTADVLQRAYVPYVEHDECVRKMAPIAIQETYICAGGHNKTDTCSGDSGGGLIGGGALVGNRQKNMIFGVVAKGVNCNDKNAIFPGIYTDVKHYLPWIMDNISP